MGVALDESLINKIRRKPREDALTFEDCVVANLFWRKHVNVKILSKVFRASKNTLYYRALTGTADSYPNSIYANQANDINNLIDRLGVEEAWNRYVADDMVEAVNAEMAAELKQRDG